MRRKMFSILTSSALFLQGISSSTVLANGESKFEPMEEVETLTETESTSSQESNIASGNLGNSDVTWKITEDGTLIIGAGKFENNSSTYDWPWKKFSNEIKEIDGTAQFCPIGNYCNALSGLTNLEKVDLSGWKTSELTNTSFMFSGNDSLTSLDLSNWETKNITNMRWMFVRCSALTNLNVSNWETSQVTDMSFMFNGCSSLNTLDVSNWDTSEVTNMSQMFSVCRNLESLDLSRWTTSNVTDMRGMFANCYALTSLNVSNWVTDKVKDMSEMFLTDYNLTSLDLSDWETPNLEKMNSIFSGCRGLTSLNLSNWETPKVLEMHSAFALCHKLTTLDLSKWITSNITDMHHMFKECNSLTTLNISSWDTTKVSEMSGLGEGCNNLKEINYNSKCENLVFGLLSYLPQDLLWAQNGKGTHLASKIPPLSEGELATLTRAQENSSNQENNPNSNEDQNKDNNSTSSEDNKNGSDGKEDDPNLKDDDNDSNPNVDPDPCTPTQTGDSSTVVVDLYIKNNQALAGIRTENGSLPETELMILETYLNTTPNYNPNDYSVTIVNASVSKNTGNNEKYNFELTVAITLKEESRINFVINKLEKKMKSEDATINESGLITLSLEDAQTTPSYTVKEIGDKIIIEGLLVKDAFGNDNQIDGSFIKGILDDEGYDASTLDFTSTQSKNSTFILHDLTSLVTIEISANSEEDKQPEPENPSSTRPSTNSSGGSTSPKPTPTPSNPIMLSIVRKSAYRFFNTLTGEHFYTTNESERNQLIQDSRWRNEGEGWKTPEFSNYPIYRLCNPNTGEHHYTMDKNEYNTLATYGWQQEGIGLYSADSEDSDVVQLHRLYNPNTKDAGSHHYTADETEKDTLVNQGWKYEGIAWHGLKP